MTTHVERVAMNQALYRAANERMRAWPERQDAESAERLEYYCECPDNRCGKQVSMARDEYEAVRASSRRFVVAPGHVYPEAEWVAEEHEDYVVVEKLPRLAHILEATDPRG